MSSKTLRLAALALALAPVSSAQQFFGSWETGNGPPKFQLYVSTTGSDMNPGTAALPFRTITTAVFIASSLRTVAPVTVNVAPGTYSAMETFPIPVPAHGLALESWGPGRATIDAGFSGAAIQVNELGNEAQPNSVIRALEIRRGNPAIDISPVNPGSPTLPVAVEIRQCRIPVLSPTASVGIRIMNPGNWDAQHVIEENDIGGPAPSPGGVGIFEVDSGESSTLIRSNHIQLWEENVRILGSGETCRPRLFSNHIQIAERNVVLSDCDPFVVNNTIAFAFNFTSVPVVEGLNWTGGVLNLHNNILWNPVLGSGAMQAIDLITSGTVVARTNNIEDLLGTPPNVPPQFVGGDAHPASFNPKNLHLTLVSPMIGAGTNSDVFAAGATILELFVGGSLVRRDVNMDVDLDPRVLAAPSAAAAVVDIGGDEVRETRMDFVGDPFGNAPLATGSVTVSLTGPPNGSYSVFLAVGFFDTLANPATGNIVPNTPVYQNLFSVFGNVLFDVTTNLNFLWATGTYNGAGTATTTISLGPQGVQFAESELYLQAFSVDQAGVRASLSNRLFWELNE